MGEPGFDFQARSSSASCASPTGPARRGRSHNRKPDAAKMTFTSCIYDVNVMPAYHGLESQRASRALKYLQRSSVVHRSSQTGRWEIDDPLTAESDMLQPFGSLHGAATGAFRVHGVSRRSSAERLLGAAARRSSPAGISAAVPTRRNERHMSSPHRVTYTQCKRGTSSSATFHAA